MPPASKKKSESNISPPPPPLRAPGAPPPPSAPPSARQVVAALPDRAGLLGDISKGKKLKKTATNDRSGPLVDGKNSATGVSSSQLHGSAALAAVPVIKHSNTGTQELKGPSTQLGGLFANGMPTLRKNSRAADLPPAPPTLPPDRLSPGPAPPRNIEGLHRAAPEVRNSARTPGIPPPPPPPPTQVQVSSNRLQGTTQPRVASLGLPPSVPITPQSGRSRASSIGELTVQQPPPRPSSGPPSLPKMPPPTRPAEQKSAHVRMTSAAEPSVGSEEKSAATLPPSRPIAPLTTAPARQSSQLGLNSASNVPSVDPRPSVSSPQHNGGSPGPYSLKSTSVGRIDHSKYKFQPIGALPVPRIFTNCPKVFRSGRPGGSTVPLQLSGLR